MDSLCSRWLAVLPLRPSNSLLLLHPSLMATGCLSAEVLWSFHFRVRILYLLVCTCSDSLRPPSFAACVGFLVDAVIRNTTKER